MRLYYEVPKQQWPKKEWPDSLYRAIEHLPKKRMRCSTGSRGEVVIELNSAQAVGSIRVLLGLAAGHWECYEFNVIYEPEPACWIDDLEPDSMGLAFRRMGPPGEDLEPFEYNPPDEIDLSSLDWKADAEGKVEGELNCWFMVCLNLEGLLSIAFHMAALAQDHVPVGEAIEYEPGRELQDDSFPLTVKKCDFPDDVPWA